MAVWQASSSAPCLQAIVSGIPGPYRLICSMGMLIKIAQALKARRETLCSRRLPPLISLASANNSPPPRPIFGEKQMNVLRWSLVHEVKRKLCNSTSVGAHQQFPLHPCLRYNALCRLPSKSCSPGHSPCCAGAQPTRGGLCRRKDSPSPILQHCSMMRSEMPAQPRGDRQGNSSA